MLSSDACGMRYHVFDWWRYRWGKSKGKEIHREFDCMIDTSLLCIGNTVSCCSLGVFLVSFPLGYRFFFLLRGIFSFIGFVIPVETGISWWKGVNLRLVPIVETRWIYKFDSVSVRMINIVLSVISNLWDQVYQSSELHRGSKSEIPCTKCFYWTFSRRDFSLSFEMTNIGKGRSPHIRGWHIKEYNSPNPQTMGK